MFKMKAFLALSFVWTGFWCSSLAGAVEAPPVAEESFRLEYRVVLDPQTQSAQVTMQVDKGEWLRKLNFSNKKNIYTSIKASGKLIIKDDRVYWEPPHGKAFLSYRVKLTHERDPG